VSAAPAPSSSPRRAERSSAPLRGQSHHSRLRKDRGPWEGRGRPARRPLGDVRHAPPLALAPTGKTRPSDQPPTGPRRLLQRAAAWLPAAGSGLGGHPAWGWAKGQKVLPGPFRKPRGGRIGTRPAAPPCAFNPAGRGGKAWQKSGPESTLAPPTTTDGALRAKHSASHWRSRRVTGTRNGGANGTFPGVEPGAPRPPHAACRGRAVRLRPRGTCALLRARSPGDVEPVAYPPVCEPFRHLN
jgi:hypothetical protein